RPTPVLRSTGCACMIKSRHETVTPGTGHETVMKLIALLIGLIVERLATQLFHLRELRWLDRVIDFGFRQVDRYANWPPLLLVVLLAFVLVLPVLLLRLSLGDALYGFPYLIFAVLILFFSLGPRD